MRNQRIDPRLAVFQKSKERRKRIAIYKNEILVKNKQQVNEDPSTPVISEKAAKQIATEAVNREEEAAAEAAKKERQARKNRPSKPNQKKPRKKRKKIVAVKA